MDIRRATEEKMTKTVAELKAEIELLRKENAELRLKVLTGVVKVCSSCKSLQTPSGQWIPLDRFLELYTSASCSHGYCEECAQRLIEDALTEESRA
ncbi:MAG: hypothetical protein LBE49_04090 [Deltaproteobacteria bacterium]|jgi:ribosomal protein L29|nr:hypothetical protein [Deltaproteobacteria bacterium]